MNITVYLGSSKGNDGSFKMMARELGTWIGESDNTLVYGGSEIGLMGILAKSVVGAGGKAIGVIVNRVKAENTRGGKHGYGYGYGYGYGEYGEDKKRRHSEPEAGEDADD